MVKSQDIDSDACEEKLKKLKIKLGKDNTGRITSGKIISERNRTGGRILLKMYQLRIINYHWTLTMHSTDSLTAVSLTG